MNMDIHNKLQTVEHIAADYERINRTARDKLAASLRTDRQAIAGVLSEVSALQVEGKYKEATTLLTDIIVHLRWQGEM